MKTYIYFLVSVSIGLLLFIAGLFVWPAWTEAISIYLIA